VWLSRVNQVSVRGRGPNMLGLRKSGSSDEAYERYFMWSLIALFLVFFIVAHGLCWLNPSTGRPSVSFPIPYGWEYDCDSGVELCSAIDFPEGMLREKFRIARPLKNALLSVPSKLLELVVPLSLKTKKAISYIGHHLMNFLLLFLILFVLFRLGARARVEPEGLFVVSVWLLFATLTGMATSHTYLFQIATPAMLMLFLLRAMEIEEWSRRDKIVSYILYSALCGFTALIKQQYAPFLAVLAFVLLTRRWMLALIWATTFHLPLLFYRLSLHLTHVQWYSHETQFHRQGVWWLDSLRSNGLSSTVKKFMEIAASSADLFASYYGLVLLGTAFLGFCVKPIGAFQKNLRLFAVLMIGANFIQTIGAARLRGYMFGDSFLVVALFFSTGYGFLLKEYSSNRIAVRLGFFVFLIVNISIVLASHINLPWVSPFEQLQRP